MSTDPAPGPLADSQRVTRRRVARSLLENGPSTAADLAARLDVTPAAVRRHVDGLLADGHVVVREHRPRGPRGRGRPARAFALTDAGRAAFPQAYDELAVGALRYLADRLGPEGVRGFARDRTERLGAHLAGPVSAAPPAARVAALAEGLTAAGYAATAVGTDAGGAQLCQHHCPVAHVAGEFPELCETEAAMFAELLGTHVTRLATIAHGDGVCTTHVPAPPAAQAAPPHQDHPVPSTRRTSR